MRAANAEKNRAVYKQYDDVYLPQGDYIYVLAGRDCRSFFTTVQELQYC